MTLSLGMRRLVADLMGWGLGLGLLVSALVFHEELFGASRALLGVAPAPVHSTRGEPEPIRQTQRGQRTVEIAAGSGGHYFARAEINGRAVDVMVDTGATMVALSYEDAQNAGLSVRDSDFTQRVSTANGFARVAPVVLERVEIDGVMVRNVAAAIAEPGRLQTTLLGMSFLGKLRSVGIRAGRLVLEE